MNFRSNPFIDRASEKTTRDEDFVNLFSPHIFERIDQDILAPIVHIFRSPPGMGKTTLFRVFTPTAIKALWNQRESNQQENSVQSYLKKYGIKEDENKNPLLLGVFLSCSSGYIDLPNTVDDDKLFRELLSLRIILQTLRGIKNLYDLPDNFEKLKLSYDSIARDLKVTPLLESPKDLFEWVSKRERSIYMRLDSFQQEKDQAKYVMHQIEGILWLQSVQFDLEGRRLELTKLLMIDDLHRLRKAQRELLKQEIPEMRASIPIWFAERDISFGDELICQGVREGREIQQIKLAKLFSEKGKQLFESYAQSILERRLRKQTLISNNFSQSLEESNTEKVYEKNVKQAISQYLSKISQYKEKESYQHLIKKAIEFSKENSINSLKELVRIWILISRKEGKKQLSFDFLEVIEDPIETKERGAIDIFLNKEAGIPYYFGMEKISRMATKNPEELLNLASYLYEALAIKKIASKRNQSIKLSTKEQETHLKKAAKDKWDFIPKSHTEGRKAQNLLLGIATFCREKTFLPNAPYAPGVVGVRLTKTELDRLFYATQSLEEEMLKKVLIESVAENLLTTQESSKSSSREAGTVFYLNQTLCMHFNLPLNYGGWQDVRVSEMIKWMKNGAWIKKTSKKKVFNDELI